MVKLIAYYKTPQDTNEFDRKYFEEHLPLAGKMPGLVKAEVYRLKGLGGSSAPFYLQTDMYFNSINDLNSAMMSDEGKAAAKNLMSFAKELVTMVIAEPAE